MRILIVEDNNKHKEGAREQLGGKHELKIVDNWPSAKDEIKKFKPDVVLTDLMLPSTTDMLSDKAIIKYPQGTIMPLGFIVALHAALASSVKGIALLTDRDHHSDPVSAGLDYTGEIYWGYDHPTADDKTKPTPPFNINGKKAIFSFAPMVGEVGNKKKDWGKALDVLMS